MSGSGDNSCIEEIWQEFPAFTQYEVRSALARCGLTTKHIESRVKVLSGGEQAKVRLCKLMNRATNVLLLDEPTNHLDVDAKDELKRALKEYKEVFSWSAMSRNSTMAWLPRSGICPSGPQSCK